MTQWILFTAPLIIASLVLVLGFVGCGLNSMGTAAGTTPTPYEDAVGNHPNIVSYWRLGERSGTTATDTADGNPGEYTGGVTLGQPGLAEGDEDGAALFDGTSGYVAVPHNANLNPPAFTVEALVNLTAGDGAFHAIVSSRDLGAAGEPFGYILYAGPGAPGEADKWQAWVGTGAGTMWATLPGPDLTAGTHYVALTYDKTTLRVYVDPTEETPFTLDTTYAPNANTELRIGAGANEVVPPLYFWSGVIDEVAIYDAALDFATIQEHSALALTGVSEG